MRKNLFLLPTGSAGKEFINDTTRLLNAWTQNSPMKKIATKAVMIMPSLLLLKPAKNFKSKDHRNAIERRLQLRYAGDMLELMIGVKQYKTDFQASMTRNQSIKHRSSLRTG